MKTKIIASLILGLVALPSLAQAGAPSCDRSCLEGYVDRYLNAMEANTVSPELFAPGTRFTENGVQLPLGSEGLWYGMSGKGTYKFYVPDIETQQVAFIGTLREGGKTTTDGALVAIALRLKIAGNRISEVEQLVARPETPLGGAAANTPPPRFPPAGEAIEKMGAPHPVYSEIVPANKRVSRAEMVKNANYYFAGLQRNDGKGYYPFTDDCDRFENGMKTTNNPQRDPATGQTVTRGCKKQFEETQKGIVSRIRDRRFVAVDQERGIVFSFVFFDHNNLNWTWQMAELFKIESGQIRRVEAVFFRSAYGMNSGWSTYEQGISEEPREIR